MRWPRFTPLKRDHDGLPIVSDAELYTARVVAVLATVGFTLVAAWEMFGPLLAGHYAASASVGIIADNMLQWNIGGPVWEYTAREPVPNQYYCHHPWGIFWTTAALMKVFGRYDFVCRLAPVLLSSATPPLFYALGRAIWRPAAGAAAALCFVVLPISLAFANFNALEVPVIAWSLLGMWGFVRHTQTAKRRHLVLSLAGFFMALHADWPAYVLVGTLLAFGLMRALPLRRLFGPLKFRRYVTWWILLATLAVGTGLLYLYLFQSAGKLNDLLQSYHGRSLGRDTPLDQVLNSRRYWIELSFTPVAIALGKVAAIVCAGRLLGTRREHEVIPLAVLLMATFQYVAFKQGADIHIFWPHYFAAFFALGMGALTATALALGEWSAKRNGRSPLGARVGIAAAVLLIALIIVRDGFGVLAYARGSGGRFNEKGRLIHSDGAKTAFLRWLDPQLDPKAVVTTHASMKTTWAQMWTLRRVVRQHQPPPPPEDERAVYLIDTRFMYDETQQRVAAKHHITAVGPFWKLTPGAPHQAIDAHAIVELEPSVFESYFISGTEPQRFIAQDAYRTWELRHHFDQAATPPDKPPHNFEQVRIAHNLALARGHGATAEAHFQRLSAQLVEPRARFDDGSELLGVRFQNVGRATLTLLFRAGAPHPHDIQIGVESRVIEPASWSTTMADPTVREVGIPAALSPRRWRQGYLYSYPVVIRKRPGTEVFSLYFKLRRLGPGRDLPAPHVPKTKAGARAVEVLRLH